MMVLFFTEKMHFLKAQEEKQIFPPKFVFPKVIQDSKNIITGTPFDKSSKLSPLLEDIRNKIKKTDISKKDQTKLLADAKQALLEYVKPAYIELINYSELMHKRLTNNFGVWGLPKGEEFYNFRLKKITTLI